jgi:chloramphenicol 3-O phosphotransferase
MSARLIVLNGVGSVGKSSTAKALQRLADQAFLHVQGDAFLDMLPPQAWGRPEGIIFRQFEENGFPSVEIEMGNQLTRLMDGMRASVAALAKAGSNCIVDDVMLSPSAQQSYIAECRNIPVQFVALHAPLEILEKRERDRGDRVIGLARWQYERLHHGIEYDFEIDTSASDPDTIARSIASALHIPITAS